ncbi:MAG: VOC family protein [Rhizobiaceae bacterium]
MTGETKTRGAHHIGLTVPDLAETKAFFLDVLGFSQVGEVPAYPAVFLTDGITMITLWQAENSEKAVPFDRKNVIGLHHLALNVASMQELKELYSVLKNQLNVGIEFAPEPLGESGANHMMCNIPGGIRVEFLAAA